MKPLLLCIAAASALCAQAQFAPPLSVTFDSQEQFSQFFTVADANGDGETWYWVPDEGDPFFPLANCAGIGYGEEPMDDYLVTSQPVSLKAGKNYVHFDYAARSYYPEALEVRYGTSSNPAQMQLLCSLPYIVNDEYERQRCELTLPQDQDIYVAFRCVSNADCFGMYVDNVTIGAGEWVAAPDAELVRLQVPMPGSIHSAAEQVTATIANRGDAALTGFALLLDVAGSRSQPVAFVLDHPLQRGESTTVSLPMGADLAPTGLHTITATVQDVTGTGGTAEPESALGNNTLSATTRTMAAGKLPMSADFTQGDHPGMWASQDDAWHYSDEAGLLQAGEEPLGSASVTLEAGGHYGFEMSYAAGALLYGTFQVPASFEVRYGEPGTDVAGWTVLEARNSEFTNFDVATLHVQVAPQHSGPYAFAVVATNGADFLWVRDITISALPQHGSAVTAITVPTMAPASWAGHVPVVATVANTGWETTTIDVEYSNDLNSTTGSCPAGSGLAYGKSATAVVPANLGEVRQGDAATITLTPVIGEDRYAPAAASNAVTLTASTLAADKVTPADCVQSRGVGGIYESTLAMPFTLAHEAAVNAITIGWAGEAPIALVPVDVRPYDPATGQVGQALAQATGAKAAGSGFSTIALPETTLAPGHYVATVTVGGTVLATDLDDGGVLLMVDGATGKANVFTSYGNGAIRMEFGYSPAARGDVNADGLVDAADVAALVAVINGNGSSQQADVSGDGAIDASDVTALVGIILGMQ